MHLQSINIQLIHRYIEIFRSSLSEIQNVLGYQTGRRPGGFNSRPGPYDRESRYGGGGGGGRFQSRGSRSFKGANFSNNGPGDIFKIFSWNTFVSDILLELIMLMSDFCFIFFF